MSTSGGGKDPESRKCITVLVLGDEGVGKSSLISTYVSRHFSEGVPGIMTHVRLPPEPESPCITTIVDSQGGDAALMSAVTAMSLPPPADSSSSLSSLVRKAAADTSSGNGASKGVVAGIEHVDSIVLVYDLDRVETFYRLENHWLPLIERSYNGELPVIVAGNKMDLFRPSSSSGITDEQSLLRSRQKINSLLQRFKFVLQWIKCSAKNLLHIDEVFRKAQHAVIFPISPLYDLSSARLTVNCRRALTRIFRMYDKDSDGLLSNDELDEFQCQAFPVRLVERDFAGWKKVVSRNNTSQEAVVKDGKFTVAGFLAIFEVFITQNRLESPWRALRSFGYDDELNLRIPPSVTFSLDGKDLKWRLSTSARQFLTSTFHKFDSDHDGILSSGDIREIFSIVPEPSLPPWHPVRAATCFDGCVSTPRLGLGLVRGICESPNFPDTDAVALSSSLSASGITICSASSLPSVDISSLQEDAQIVSSPLSFSEWMGRWHMISSICPSTTQSELYRLGYIEDGARTTTHATIIQEHWSSSSRTLKDLSEALCSRESRILVIGSRRCGKTALIDALCRIKEPDALKTIVPCSTKPETSITTVRLRRKLEQKVGKLDGVREEVVVHMIFTEIPGANPGTDDAGVASSSPYVDMKDDVFDAVLLAFDCTDLRSFLYAKSLESSLLKDSTPRVFVGLKSVASMKQQTNETTSIDVSSRNEYSVKDAATKHCEKSDLEPPLIVSISDMLSCTKHPSLDLSRSQVLDHLARCVIEEVGLDHLRSTPHAERKRKEAAMKRMRMLWLGGLFGVSFAVVIGMGVIWGGAAKGGRKERIGGWLRQVLGTAAVGISASCSSSEA